MEAGDFVSVWVYAHEDTSYSVSSQSGFSCVLVETIEGFGADLASPQSITSTAWTEVSNWEVSGSDGRGGLFSLGSGFDPSSGRYTASVEGVYFASAQVSASGSPSTDALLASGQHDLDSTMFSQPRLIPSTSRLAFASRRVCLCGFVVCSLSPWARSTWVKLVATPTLDRAIFNFVAQMPGSTSVNFGTPCAR